MKPSGITAFFRVLGCAGALQLGEQQLSVTSVCPSPFTEHSADGFTFCRGADNTAFAEAATQCQSIGMQLVEITTEAKAAAIDSWCQNTEYAAGVYINCGWLGLTCPSQTSECNGDSSLWTWTVDGSSLDTTYNAFELNQGTFIGGGNNEFCAHWKAYQSGRGNWAPAHCELHNAWYPPICEASSAAQTDPGAAATGDPHMQNVHGERFDLMRQGKVVLIEIPRGKHVENALLVVEADARRLGEHCADMYFQRLNITGAWADEAHAGGLTFDAHTARESRAEWQKFGPLELKVVHGRTEKDILYLNFYVKHLGVAGFDVGGLLGEDDHSWVATPEGECVNTVSLSKAGSDGHSAASSVAAAISA